MKDKQTIIATLESIQDNEKTTHQYEGELYLKEKSFYIRYTEQTEAGEVRHFLRYEPNQLTVSRKGSIQSEQLYRVGEVRSGYYDNGVIRLELGALTHKLRILDKASKTIEALPTQFPFSLEWEYELIVEEQSTGRFAIRLYIQEVNL